MGKSELITALRAVRGFAAWSHLVCRELKRCALLSKSPGDSAAPHAPY